MQSEAERLKTGSSGDGAKSSCKSGSVTAWTREAHDGEKKTKSAWLPLFRKKSVVRDSRKESNSLRPLTRSAIPLATSLILPTATLLN